MLQIVDEPKVLSPLLRWVGKKFFQPTVCNRIAELYEPYRQSHVWFEPFAGALGLTYQIRPDKAFLSDSNPFLIRFHKAVQSGCQFTDYQWMLGTPYAELTEILNQEISRYARMDASVMDDCEFAALFYQVNRRSFNGLWRQNGKGKFNVPAGRNNRGDLLSAPFPDLAEHAQLMKGWTIKCCQWYQVNALSGVPMWIVCDPPYDDSFVGYSDNGFDWHDQVLLANWALAKARQGLPIVLLNKATPRVIDLYERYGFTVEIVSARRSVNCNGNRAKQDEVIAHRNCI